MPMGPFRLSDLVGSDIGLHVGKNFVDSFPERVYVSRIFPLMVEAKRLGEKSGAGFYKVSGWGCIWVKAEGSLHRAPGPHPPTRPGRPVAHTNHVGECLGSWIMMMQLLIASVQHTAGLGSALPGRLL
jgi:3-hydroxyacyl-CoA dehydrogenase